MILAQPACEWFLAQLPPEFEEITPSASLACLNYSMMKYYICLLGQRANCKCVL